MKLGQKMFPVGNPKKQFLDDFSMKVRLIILNLAATEYLIGT